MGLRQKLVHSNRLLRQPVLSPQDKDRFFSIMAHDLKSPFTALLGYSEVISQECEELTMEEIKEFSTNEDEKKFLNTLNN